MVVAPNVKLGSSLTSATRVALFVRSRIQHGCAVAASRRCVPSLDNAGVTEILTVAADGPSAAGPIARPESQRVNTTPDTVAAYFRALEEAGAAYATIGRRKTAIAKLIEAEALLTGQLNEDPTKHPKVAVTLNAIRRRLGTDQDQAIPLTGDRLIQVLLAIDDQTLAGRRDIALLLIGFYGAMRRSELAGMRRDQLEQPTSRWDPVAALEDWLTTR